jgi:hypothetical protein
MTSGYRAVIRALRKRAEMDAVEEAEEEGFFGKCTFCGELKFDLIHDPDSIDDAAFCWDCREGDELDWEDD